MESEARKELEAVFTKELKNQRKIGFDIGFAYGEEEGAKKALEWIQCELFKALLLSKQATQSVANSGGDFSLLNLDDDRSLLRRRSLSDLIYTDLLDEQQIMDLFRIDEERIKEIRKIIKTPKWFFSHQTGRITL